MPYKRESTGQWIAQVIFQKKEYTHRCKTKKEALQWEQEKKYQLLHPEVEPQPVKGLIHITSLADWAKIYLDHAEKTFTKKTYEDKCFAFREMFQNINPDIACKDLTSGMVLAYLQTSQKSRSGHAANKSRKELHAAWEWGAVFHGIPSLNPFHRVPRFAEIKIDRIVPTLEHFHRVFAVVDNDSDRCMLFMYMQTGARRDELFRLKWKDVDLAGKRVRLRWRKNVKGEWREAWLSIKDEMAAMLEQQRRVTGLRGFVFMYHTDDNQWLPYEKRQHWLPRLCKRAQVVPEFGIHGIRHLFASILAVNNVALVEIQGMLRHGSITTTAKYIHSLNLGSRGTADVLDALPSLENEGEKIKSRQKAVSGN